MANDGQNEAQSGGGSTARLFIGLWPDEQVRQALFEHQQRWQWPPGAALVRRERLHITLHFLGDVAHDRIQCLQQALEGVRGSRFPVRCEGPQRWHGGLVVLGVAASPPLLALQQAVGSELQALGLPLGRRPYTPHVTLARRAEGAQPPAECPPIDWKVNDWALIESQRMPPGGYAVRWQRALVA